ncbi:MAG TPA: PBP1A family penicillin-binding protein [Syntrophomonadaceae bacterium]|nr:PBP1A family penicillin-binding protein [Syntrophomonadaceae bacterium]
MVGATITDATPKILLYATGINNWEYQPRGQTVVYYSDGQEMTRLGYQRIFSEEFPQFIKDAVVAVEDRRFYEHAGFDAKGIGRAIWVNIKAGSKAEGGSTITQQLARTMFLGNEKTYTRKIKEVLIASAIEEKYSKDAILNMYLNEVFMGRGSSGIATGARIYFNKDVTGLDEAEMSLLVGMIQAPEFYSPDTNYTGLKKRQAVVIDTLIGQGIIDSARGEAIKAQTVYFRSYKPDFSQHPYLVTYLTYLLEEQLGAKYLYMGGLSIHTSINRNMQSAAENTVASQVRSLSSRGINAQDAALVSVEPATGAIRAYVGGADFNRNQINMANQPRQPGSAIKPLYYAGALNEGKIYPDTKLNNKPRQFGEFRPENNSASSPETTDVREALINSYNVASVEVLNLLGLEEGVDYIEKFGVTTIAEADKNLALALGGMSKGISPLQMAAAFAVFPNQGVYQEPYIIKTITDVNGKIIYDRQPQSHIVITRTVAGLMNEILQQAVRYGTGSSAAIAVASAGKTGTTTDSRDLWYVGYIDELATAVWVGNSDNTAVTGYRTYGGAVAAPIWRDYMNKLYYNYWLEQKPVPQEVTEPLPEENEEPEENPEETNEETNPENPEETPDNTEPELPGMPDESETTAPPAETEQTTNLPAPEPIIPREAAGF